MRWLLVVCACAVAFGFDVQDDIVPVDRSSKFFPWFTVVRFSNNPCLGENNFNGTCYTRRQCSAYGGIASGSCGSGVGVCCIIQRTCGGNSLYNCTYFINPNYPSYYSGGSRCSLTINKCNDNICQLRLDFFEFSLAQPNFNGVCLNDFFTVTGGSSLVPRICGENTGQHIYVDFDEGSSPIQLSIDTDTGLTFSRRWNIKISQIACDSTSKAPVGCLMYYAATTGTVKSFNFGTSVNTNVPAGLLGLRGTREMANLNYGVCVRMSPGYCSIVWSQDTANDYSFSVSGDTEIQNNQPIVGTDCLTDFVVIPNPQEGGTNLPYDRFCGNRLGSTGSITTFSKPFVLTVVTDNSEFNNATNINQNPDVANRGFCLTYRQVPCPP